MLVRLVGQGDVVKVSWRRVFQIAGPDMTIIQAVQDSALHDLQRFKVESFEDWGFADDGSVVFKVNLTLARTRGSQWLKSTGALRYWWDSMSSKSMT